MKSPGLVATQTHAFLFADLEGSTAMWRRVEDAYPGMRAGHHRLIQPVLAAHDNEQAAAERAGFSAVFVSSRACVDAAIGMLWALVSHLWPGGERARVGGDMGSCEASRTVVGLEMHREARFAAVAHGGLGC
jgi:class 3 adenylate cyclase